MSMQIEKFEPTRLPVPYTRELHLLHRRRFKQLGITPTVENGIRTWRVIWRPFLRHPVPYTRPDGTPGLKRKADNVRTLRFCVVGDVTEESAYRDAMREASLSYLTKLPHIMPIVDWEGIAKAKGQKLRDSYSKPALNGAIYQALELFQEGYGLGQVAEQLGVNKSTACRWRQKFRKEKALP